MAMNKVRTERRTLGVNFRSGIAEILVWAPNRQNIALQIMGGQTLTMARQQFGYWMTVTDQLKPGMNYRFIADGEQLPDMASLYQPEGVHGPSQAFDVALFNWTDEQWQNIPLADHIFYELHTGTFSPDGTFKGIEQKLDHLISLGINAIEIMPVAQFPGERNWGYDGVFPFAVQNSYGGPQALQQLINTCHNKGLAVVLDVVYNHVGPEGNYFEKYGPYFTNKYHTPWGNAVNFDDAGCDHVRRYFIENALMWFRDFHVDALRMDAVHAIKDFSPKHILREIREHVDELMKATGRTHYLIVECDLNDTRFIAPVSEHGYGMDAQWTDEFHHALRIAAGGKKDGYYSDFDGITSLKDAYANGYVYTGQYSAHRDKDFGTTTDDNPGQRFVVFSQNHDQVGNRMLGERSSQLFDLGMQKLLAGAVMVSPFLPMLFMGEEMSAPSPFLYFVSHTDKQLIAAVRKGRKEEFAAFHAEGEAPDPQAAETFERSKIPWDILGNKRHQTMLNYYKALIALRKKHPALKIPDRKNCTVEHNITEKTITLIRTHTSQTVICALNFSDKPQPFQLPDNIAHAQKLFSSADEQWGGNNTRTEVLNKGDRIHIEPHSLLIYSQYHV